MAVRILLADDHQVVRQALRAALEAGESLEVVAEAEDGRQAVDLARELAPDVVVMDIHMPGLNGTEAARRIAREVKGARVLMLSMSADKQYVRAALDAGAAGFLKKSCSMDELVKAIGQVAAGYSYLDPQVAATVMDLARRDPREPEAGRLAVLSSREREVLQLVAEGHSNQGIAEQLHLSEATVDTHRRNLMRKLGVRGVAELTRLAIREGLVSLDG
jgi:DNA-binding NarL/FixJ family response regulator